MGKFIYESDLRLDFDDRVLAHLQAVIGTKLRRGESFYFSWKDDSSIGNGRTTVWLHPRVSLVYKFYGNRSPSINSLWIEALMFTANSPAGLYTVPEPAQESPATPSNGNAAR
ncbi:hypothetical protein [Microbacterium yannicii]|uniref:DUF7882 family protein n=1 Tax=Microbacterium yannicii TaxID=671622 RepID=UPI0002DBA5EB|nr:hypothetical protein [Microbacterium yannicii]